MINDHPAIKKYATTAIRNLWERRCIAPAEELADIDADLWRLLEAVATGKLPRRAAEYHGPAADRAISVQLYAIKEANMVGEWTTQVVLTRRRNGDFTLKFRIVEDGKSHCVHRSRPFRSASVFLDHLLAWDGLEFGEGRRHGPIQALLPWVALLSSRLADDVAVELLTLAVAEE